MNKKNISLQVYHVFHRTLPKKFLKYENESTTFYSVNEDINKNINPEFLSRKIIHEYQLEHYNKMFQDCGYNEASALAHIGMNGIHKSYEYIGFSQYDQVIDYPKNMEKNICCYYCRGKNHLNEPAFPVSFFFEQYNNYFEKSECFETLLSKSKAKNLKGNIPLLSTFVISSDLYDILYKFWIELMFNLFPLCKIENNNTPKHHRHIGGIMERAFGITLVLNDSLQIFKKKSCRNLHIRHENYQHAGGDIGDGHQTPSEILLKYSTGV